MLLVTEADQVAAIHRLALERRVDGVVLFNIVDDDPRLAALRAHDLPVVLLGMPADSQGLDAVDLDFAEAARALVRHLRDRGHREALFVRWAPEMFAQRNSFVLRFNDAAADEARRVGLALRPVDCPADPERLPEALTVALTERGDATAVMVHNDAASALLPAALHAAGLQIPRDVSVVSIHSAELGRALALPFTSVETVPGEVSDAVLGTLMARIAAGQGGAQAQVSQHLIAPQITDRGSVRDLD